jgi:hypothetical protein
MIKMVIEMPLIIFTIKYLIGEEKPDGVSRGEEKRVINHLRSGRPVGSLLK